MASLTAPINVVVDKETKEEATAILKDLGLSMSTAINLFLKQLIMNDGLPFEVKKKPSKEMRQALKEAEEMAKKYNTTKEELIKNIGGLDMIIYDTKMRRAMEVLKEK